MLIWRYLVPTNYGNAHAYGTPVDVFLPGIGRTQVVYQFPADWQSEAVVHWQSGQILARIPAGPGWPQGKAQAAVNALTVSPDKIARAHVINENPEVF